MTNAAGLRNTLREEEAKLLGRLRHSRQAERQYEKPVGEAPRRLGAKVADRVAVTVGSWPFVIMQSVLLLIWIVLNITAFVQRWDPYPFILLNLALSFQAAYTAPIIMMSQNRQAVIDREAARRDYEINLKAELEIELLHQKLDLLRETEMANLIATLREFQQELRLAREKSAAP
jgi:uncharacterized membrane protein